MALNERSADLVRRLLAGEDLSADERAEVERQLPNNPPHRPRRASLQLVEAELGRVAHFVDAQLRGESYVSSVAFASERSHISERRVKGALKWLGSVTHLHWKEAVQALGRDAEFDKRIRKGGLDALEPKEILLLGSNLAFQKAIDTLSREERAVLFVNHAEAIKECIGAIIDATWTIVAKILASGAYGVPSNANLATLVEAVGREVAKAEVQKLADLLH